MTDGPHGRISQWLWRPPRPHGETDIRNHAEFLPGASLYVAGMAVGTVVVLLSAALPATPRLVVWACCALSWVLGMVLAVTDVTLSRALTPTESLVERFGLYTIIVLGEVVFGVVDGLSAHDRDVKTITTGMVALVVGFGFWWIYFDLVGRRLPRADGRALVSWLMSHLPITLSIAAAGAAMVSLIGHAHDARTPSATAWLLSAAVALGLLALVLTERSLADAERLDIVYRPLRPALAAGAGAALFAGWARPAPWLLALLLVCILGVLWLFAVTRFMSAGEWGEERSAPAEEG